MSGEGSLSEISLLLSESSSPVPVPVYCFGVDARDPLVCSGNGTCVNTDFCSCFNSYTGRICDEIVQQGNRETNRNRNIGIGVGVGLGGFVLALVIVLSIVGIVFAIVSIIPKKAASSTSVVAMNDHNLEMLDV